MGMWGSMSRQACTKSARGFKPGQGYTMISTESVAHHAALARRADEVRKHMTAQVGKGHYVRSNAGGSIMTALPEWGGSN